jgi:uracil phosphoribosyltransferase
MNVHHLQLQNSILSRYIAEIRDVEQQKDSMRFRRNLERIAEIMAYEISKTLPYQNTEVRTPLGTATVALPVTTPVIASILRAGIPMHTGALSIFDRSPSAFITAYRKHHKDNSFEIAMEHITSPDLNDEIVILCDPMIATGSSIVVAAKALLTKGTPKHIHIICAIATSEGLNYVKARMPHANVSIWCAAIDEELTAQAYIVPGLGDAGDLAFGEKL